MLVPANAMRVAMCQFFITRRANRIDGHIKRQINTCQRVIHIKVYHELARLHNCGVSWTLFISQVNYLPGAERLLFTTIYLFARHAPHSVRITSTIGLLVGYGDGKIITSQFTVKSLLQCSQNG